MTTLDKQKIEIPPNITWGFGWARNGGELAVLFQRALVEGGVEFTGFSYSDTRGEHDFSFEFEGKRFNGFVGTSFEFSSVQKDAMGWPERSYSMECNDPPTLETALYRVFSALRGERWDTYHVVEGIPIQWYKSSSNVWGPGEWGLFWSGKWNPDAEKGVR